MNELVKKEDFRGYLQSLIDSKNLPTHVKSVDTAFVIAEMGRELGFGPVQSMHYIIPIQGKLSLSAKAIGALLRKGKVQFITQEDGWWVYPDGTSSNIPRTDMKPIDQRTVIKFIRDGLEEVCTFTWKDAEKQGLTTKDNWKRMPKEMLYARCLSKGANRIGADLLLGLYSVDELADAFNVSETVIKRNEDGTIAEVVDNVPLNSFNNQNE